MSLRRFAPIVTLAFAALATSPAFAEAAPPKVDAADTAWTTALSTRMPRTGMVAPFTAVPATVKTSWSPFTRRYSPRTPASCTTAG